jgi:hypothetical protein
LLTVEGDRIPSYADSNRWCTVSGRVIDECHPYLLHSLYNLTLFSEQRADFLQEKAALDARISSEDADFIRAVQWAESAQQVLQLLDPLVAECATLDAELEALPAVCVVAYPTWEDSIHERLDCAQLKASQQALRQLGDQLAERSKTIPVYISDPRFPVDADLHPKEILRDAFRYWEPLEAVRFVEVDSLAQADVAVSWVKEFGGSPIGQAYNRNFVEIAIGDSTCFNQWQPYTDETLRTIAKHELGHVLNYSHNPDPASLMHENLTTYHRREVNATLTIPENYAYFYPTCTARPENALTYTYKVHSDLPISVYIVPSAREYEKLLDNLPFRDYPSCSEKHVRNYERTCTLDAEGGIVLYNSGSPAIATVLVSED